MSKNIYRFFVILFLGILIGTQIVQKNTVDALPVSDMRAIYYILYSSPNPVYKDQDSDTLYDNEWIQLIDNERRRCIIVNDHPTGYIDVAYDSGGSIIWKILAGESYRHVNFDEVDLFIKGSDTNPYRFAK